MSNDNKKNDVFEKLEQGIKDVFNSEHYKNYLSVMSKFHKYSFNNTLLISLQKPESTRVAGFNSWKNTFKRNVNKGEKGIQILAPTPYKQKVDIEKFDSSGKTYIEKVEVQKMYFKPVYVFDVSQTSGEPIPVLTNELAGDTKNYNTFFKSLSEISPYPISFENLDSTKGYCDPVNHKIVIKENMSEVHTIKTAIHEITHADLHTRDLTIDEQKDRRTKEVEAESVAYVVCEHYGIDTSNYSFAYLASWSSTKELDELKNSLQTIQKQSSELIEKIDTHFKELSLEEKNLQNEINDSIKFDNDIDLDKEKTREQLGFAPEPISDSKKSIYEKIESAKTKSKDTLSLDLPAKDISKSIEREER